MHPTEITNGVASPDHEHLDQGAVQSIVPKYEDAFQRFGNSLSAMLIPKDRQKERFDSLTIPFPSTTFSVLDYGCGLAHLNAYLAKRCDAFEYTGVDIVRDFIEENQRCHPDTTFKHIQRVEEVNGTFDFTVLCGVFNLCYGGDREAHGAIMRHTLRTLFEQTRVAMSVNFLSDQVDFVSPDGYHQDPLEIYTWARDVLSPRLVIDHGFMPYKFSLIVYKDATILRPQNVYRNAHRH